MTEMRTMGKPKLSQSKYDAIYTLAKQGLKAHDIVGLAPNDISMNKDKLVVKTKEFSFDEAKIVARYISDNKDNIHKYGLVFYGKAGAKSKEDNLSKAFSGYLKDKGETLESIGWSTGSLTKSVRVIEKPEDIEELLRSIKGIK